MPNMGSASVCVKNVERLISRCEDILGEKVKIKGQEWRVIKVRHPNLTSVSCCIYSQSM